MTTICDLGTPRESWADDYAETGIRAVLWGMLLPDRGRPPTGIRLSTTSTCERGDRLLREAIPIADAASKHPSGRITGFFGPSQIDTCTEGQIRNSSMPRGSATSRSRLRGPKHRGIPGYHPATGCTPIEWLEKIGVLGPDTIIGHRIFLNDHPWIHLPQANDFERLRDSGATVAHCPVVFARRGIAMNTLSRYMKAGISCGIGTDSFPHNMLDELRMAGYAGRIVAGSFTASSTPTPSWRRWPLAPT